MIERLLLGSVLKGYVTGPKQPNPDWKGRPTYDGKLFILSLTGS